MSAKINYAHCIPNNYISFFLAVMLISMRISCYFLLFINLIAGSAKQVDFRFPLFATQTNIFLKFLTFFWQFRTLLSIFLHNFL